MVRGLDMFIDHFKDFPEQFVLIGGTACDIAFDMAGGDFRATKDLDIVLCAEALTNEFVEALWKFIDSGGYEIREKSSGHRQLYRFSKPGRTGYPYMLELFSRSSSLFHQDERQNLTPIRIEEEVVSLSAILLDGEYYDWIMHGKHKLRDVPVIRPEYIIPLKARAWLDLIERKRGGEQIDNKNIKKHKNDVFRLLAIISLQELGEIPPAITADVRAFIDKADFESIDFRYFGLGKRSKTEVSEMLRTIYKISH